MRHVVVGHAHVGLKARITAWASDPILEYAAIVSSSKDWQRWHDLVRDLVRHLVDRCGIDEVVGHWSFAAWNEANLEVLRSGTTDVWHRLDDHERVDAEHSNAAGTWGSSRRRPGLAVRGPQWQVLREADRLEAVEEPRTVVATVTGPCASRSRCGCRPCRSRTSRARRTEAFRAGGGNGEGEVGASR